MTAPTVPTAPLPTTVQIALDYFDQRMLDGAPYSHWHTVRTHLLTMQREMDQWKSRANIAAGIIETATEQLAASERTCAELMNGPQLGSLVGYLQTKSVFVPADDATKRDIEFGLALYSGRNWPLNGKPVQEPAERLEGEGGE